MSLTNESPQNNRPYPFFVYGTLRPGECNYGLLKKRTLDEQVAYADGLKMFSLHYFPMAIDIHDVPSYHPDCQKGDCSIRGELLSPHPDDYEYLIEKLDRMEGVNKVYPHLGMYRRVIRTVRLEDNRTVEAWLYTGNIRHLESYHPVIPHGDWIKYRNNMYGIDD